MAKQTFTTGQVLTAAQMTSLQQTAMLGGDTTAKVANYTLVAADAGTTVAMSNAGSTTITVNTSLFAAGDIVTIQNRGAGVCTVTAGTATVNTSGSLVLAQYQGGVLYFTSTSAAIFFQFATPESGDITAVNVTSPITGGGSAGAVTIGVSAASTAASGVVQLSDSTSTTSSVLASTPTATKAAYDLADGAIAKSTVTTAGDIIYRNATVPVRLGIGTANQVLAVNSGATAPEWKTATAGGMTLISTTSFSGATTANIDSIFSSTYTSYKVLLSRWNTSGNTCVFKLRYGSNTQSTNYYGVATGINSNGTSQSTLTSAGTSFGAGFDNQTGSGVLELTFTDVGTSAIQPMWCGTWNGHANYIQLVGGQINTNWQTYTGIQFLSASGNVSGTVSVYGLAK